MILFCLDCGKQTSIVFIPERIKTRLFISLWIEQSANSFNRESPLDCSSGQEGTMGAQGRGMISCDKNHL